MFAQPAVLRTLCPYCGEKDTDDGDVAVHGNHGGPVEEIGVGEDDRDLGDVEKDREDEVGERDVIQRADAFCP